MGWVRGFGIALILGVVLLATGLGLAVRSNAAREASGEARAVTSGEASIQYFSSGAGTLAPVVLVASFARSAADFNELVAALNAAGHPTFAVETRGVRASTLPSVQVSLHTFAGDIAAVLDQEGVDEPIVMLGHAYGNRIARTFASDYPKRVATVVLLSAGGEQPSPPATSDNIGKAMISLYPEATRREAIHTAFFAKASEVSDDWMQGWYPLAGLAQVLAMGATPNEDWVNAGTAPILVLQPQEDAAAPEGGPALKRRLPDRVTLVDVPNAGHALLPEQPEFVSRTVLAYLAESAAL